MNFLQEPLLRESHVGVWEPGAQHVCGRQGLPTSGESVSNPVQSALSAWGSWKHVDIPSKPQLPSSPPLILSLDTSIAHAAEPTRASLISVRRLWGSWSCWRSFALHQDLSSVIKHKVDEAMHAREHAHLPFSSPYARPACGPSGAWPFPVWSLVHLEESRTLYRKPR